uniref:Periplasmic chaperone for outer membrane proteins Skp n=1 Tax=Candidatus Kentrum sp. DK TaxID=2126562 RepID=A0A450T0A3_9GAMM|nr:MAG: periplasmic chaperone for outer membrane proteins Skp [Candidatus Kentron sp. DK]VFJ62974.1 MAG: periplasmic chaperone for outer membrane proteins Skp [Candidatus Kentron sp. DK]
MRIIPFLQKILLIAVIFSFEVWLPGIVGAELKIGYVDTPLIMQKAPQAESAARKLEREFSPRDKELSLQQKEIIDLEEKLTRDGAVISDKEKRSLINRIRLLKRERRRLQEEFREEFTMRRNELQNDITLVIIKAIRKIAKAEDYDLVIDTVIYAGKRVDITDKVISLLKVEFEKSEE